MLHSEKAKNVRPPSRSLYFVWGLMNFSSGSDSGLWFWGCGGDWLVCVVVCCEGAWSDGISGVWGGPRRKKENILLL